VDPSSSSPAKRDMAALLQLSEDQLLLFGGRSEAGKHLQDTWLFNIPRWVTVPITGVCYVDSTVVSVAARGTHTQQRHRQHVSRRKAVAASHQDKSAA